MPASDPARLAARASNVNSGGVVDTAPLLHLLSAYLPVSTNV